MGETEAVVEQEKKPRKRVKKLPVQVLGTKDKSSLVGWVDATGPHRAYIPAELAQEGSVDVDLLEAGIAYGAPWEELLDLSHITPELFAQNLRKAGIWTGLDAERRPDRVMKAVLGTVGIGPGTIRRAGLGYE